MRWVRRCYGDHLSHFLLMLGCLAVGGYALTLMWKQGGLFRIVGWFVALLILHDLVAWPLYTWGDRALQRMGGRGLLRRRAALPWTNHVRVPLFISGVLLIVAFPLILRLSANDYVRYSGLSESPYLVHWLLVTVVLFAASALLYVLRVWRAGHLRRANPR